MNKKLIASLFVSAVFFTAGIVFAADDSVHHVRKNHNTTIFGKGGYSSAEEAHQFYTNAINDAKKANSVDFESKLETETEQIKSEEQLLEKEVSNFIKNDTGIDDGYPYLDNSAGVNDSKTIYTDNLGRKHFFGKKNLIRY